MTICKGFVDSVYCGSGVDGDGLRVVVFFSGCNLRCKFCHNPETLYKRGTETTVDEIVDKCLRYRAYVKRGGVTLSGGEPFLQRGFYLGIADRLRENGVNLVVETNGGIVDEEMIGAADGFRVDVKNQESDELGVYDDFLSVCDNFAKPVTLTNVLVPDKNSNREKLMQLAELKKNHPSVRTIKILPFHKMCVEKYERLGKPFEYGDLRAADGDDIKAAYDTLTSLLD